MDDEKTRKIDSETHKLDLLGTRGDMEMLSQTDMLDTPPKGVLKEGPMNQINLSDILAMDDIIDFSTDYDYLQEEQKAEEKAIKLTASNQNYEDDDFSMVNEFQKLMDVANVKPDELVTVNESEKLVDETNQKPPPELAAKEIPILNISEAPARREKVEAGQAWAVMENNSPIEGFEQMVPTLAIDHGFQLDPFQQRAILHLEKQESVFVAAHTSSGKTVVAEYAIALTKRHSTRVIYTSPIKALSNQKFRDFKVLFEDVGLITGDIVINPTAFCLIMTTEILRSMLYRGSDVIREVEWVIFDEVHYINDAERGVVWEEVFIMLPQHVSLIMLSATVPNAPQFAEWLGGIKQQKIYVITTSKRPVPLQYYLYTGSVGKTQDELFCIVNSSMRFLDHNYSKAFDAWKQRGKKGKNPTGAKGPQYNVMPAQEKNIYIGLLGLLNKEELLPVICFTFSRKRCSNLAELLKSQDLTTGKEKAKIAHMFDTSIEKLKEEDRGLKQIIKMREHLLQGFGVHHSGILPILKEVVEILFKDSLVKVLFATETFAMGVNMPARTVVFDSLQKHDGRQMRSLEPSEYIQMAGRAGRRNHDKIGTVVVLCKNEVPEVCLLNKIMLGSITKLESQFKLTYNMILNLLKVKTLRVEDMMKRSFVESDNQKIREQKRLHLDVCTEKLSKLTKPDCSLCSTDLDGYCKTLNELKTVQPEIMEKVCNLAISSKVLAPGRVVSFYTDYHPNVPGIMLNVKEGKCKVLTVQKETESSESPPWSKSLYCPDSKKPLVSTITLQDIQIISNKTFKHLSCEDILKSWAKMENLKKGPSEDLTSAFQDLVYFSGQARSGFQSANLNFRDLSLAESFNYLKGLQNSIQKYSCVLCPEFSNHFKCLSEIVSLEEEINSCKFKISEDSLEFHEEYTNRKLVLKNMGYIDEQDHVHLKGSVAREISNHELLITELLVQSTFNNCDPEEVAALLSCMVVQQKSNADLNDLGLSSKLKEKIMKIKGVIKEIKLQQEDCNVVEPQFEEQYNFWLSSLVYDWAKGISFADIMENSQVDVEEGIVVRCIQRLCELLKEVRSAANLIGDAVCTKKMEDASEMIKRDIVFAASLYTQ